MSMTTREQVEKDRAELRQRFAEANAQGRTLASIAAKTESHLARAAEYAAVAALVNQRRMRPLWQWEPITFELNRGVSPSLRVVLREVEGAAGQVAAASVGLTKEQVLAIQEHLSAIADVLTTAALEAAGEAVAASWPRVEFSCVKGGCPRREP